MRTLDALAHAYFDAKAVVIRAGYEPELEESATRIGTTPNESDFLREAAWVVLSSGMKTAVVAERFGLISAAFLDWRSARAISTRREDCIGQALRFFRHPGKLTAIADIAELVGREGFESVFASCRPNPISSLRQLPYIGPVTVFHLAKNLGFDVAKPDRHLQRLADAAGWTDAVTLCEHLAERVGEKVAVVDSVLWRYATLAQGGREHWMTLLQACESRVIV